MNLLWRLATPRQWRRRSLVLLLVWIAVAFAHHEGVLADAGELRLPREVTTPSASLR
ncbi:MULTISPECIES: hypothetical protein [Mycobacteriaceae]|uniref:hypothetical protein n=1 Tax=Mycobacteriaceae TaxID=1762 RepID=UPI000AA57553|nr:hypothetical protein [Mycobacterium syngnathidarum]